MDLGLRRPDSDFSDFYPDLTIVIMVTKLQIHVFFFSFERTKVDLERRAPPFKARVSWQQDTGTVGAKMSAK